MQYSERIAKLHERGRKTNIDLFLISSPAAVPYYTGYFFYFEHGNSPFHLLPALFVSSASLPPTLLLADNETAPANTADIIEVKTYSSYSYRTAPDFTRSCTDELVKILGPHSSVILRIGIEKNHLPVRICEALALAIGPIEWIDISEFISEQRAVKYPDEINLLRSSAALCDLGQQTIRRNLKAGKSELELFSVVKRELDQNTGTRTALMADLVSGIQTATAGGIPSSKIIATGDLVLADLTPCRQGYWGDCCNTFSVGPAKSKQKKDFLRVKDGLARAIDNVKPGVRASDLDLLMRKHISDYPHHSGHGVGTMSHEEPRITPYNHSRLSPGMVIALEPAIYREEYGIRLEHMILVTQDGAEILTGFDHQLEKE